MWKKWIAFSGMLAVIILLDPTHTPAQPGGPGKGGFGRDGGGFGPPVAPGGPAATALYPSPPGGYGGPGFVRQRPDASTAGPGFGGPGAGPGGPGFGGPGGPNGRPGGGMGGPGGGGPGRGMDPERAWSMMQNLTGSTGDTIDLSKVPPQTQAFLKSRAERDGTQPLPDNGMMTKAAFLEFSAKNEALRTANSGGPGNAVTMTMGPDGRMMMDPNGGFGRGPGGRGVGGPNGGWGQGGWDPSQGGWGQGGWDPSQGPRPPFEKKETEEEKPVAMRYGKLPKDLPSWFDEYDLDKDGQVSLYEWRKAGKDVKDFTEMDLNGDGLITADEYLRFARQKNINTKLDAYAKSDGADRPANWGLGAPVDGKGGDPRGKWNGPGGGPGGKGGDTKGPDMKPVDLKGGDKGDKSDRGKGNNRWNPK
jgi:hypothetical protein